MTQLATSLERDEPAETPCSAAAGARLILAASAAAWCVLLGAAFALL